MDEGTTVGVVGLVFSLAALGLGIANAVVAWRQRGRQEDAAVTGDLYPVLRTLRDSAWHYAKPLGGQQSDDLITLNAGLRDLADLYPAIRDSELREAVQALLEHDVAGIALSIDPRRFISAGVVDEALGWFSDFANLAQTAVSRCQALRRGAA